MKFTFIGQCAAVFRPQCCGSFLCHSATTTTTSRLRHSIGKLVKMCVFLTSLVVVVVVVVVVGVWHNTRKTGLKTGNDSIRIRQPPSPPLAKSTGLR